MIEGHFLLFFLFFKDFGGNCGILIYGWFCAVWRHVLGTNDAVDGVDIALGKCNNAHIYD